MNGKFRVWNESLKQWVDPSVCFLNPDGVFFTFDGGLHKAAPHYKAVFSTGLHDKNGKEIWEGDVVEHSRFLPFQVYWDDENAAFCGRRGTNDGSWISNDRMTGMAKYGKVLGNIYENPELLKS